MLEALHDYFVKFGDIKTCRIIYKHESKISRGFGFIIFYTREAAEKVIDQKDEHYINGKWVDCKSAILRQEMKPIVPVKMKKPKGSRGAGKVANDSHPGSKQNYQNSQKYTGSPSNHGSNGDSRRHNQSGGGAHYGGDSRVYYSHSPTKYGSYHHTSHGDFTTHGHHNYYYEEDKDYHHGSSSHHHSPHHYQQGHGGPNMRNRFPHDHGGHEYDDYEEEFMQHDEDAQEDYTNFENTQTNPDYTHLQKVQSTSSAQHAKTYNPAVTIAQQQQPSAQARGGGLNEAAIVHASQAPIGSPPGLQVTSSSGTHSPSNNARYNPVQQAQTDSQNGFDRGFNGSGGGIFLLQANQREQILAGRSSPDRNGALQLPTPESPMNYQPFGASYLQMGTYDRFKDGFGGFYTPQTHHQAPNEYKGEMSAKSTLNKPVNATAGFSAFAEKVKRRRTNSEEDDDFESHNNIP